MGISNPGLPLLDWFPKSPFDFSRGKVIGACFSASCWKVVRIGQGTFTGTNFQDFLWTFHIISQYSPADAYPFFFQKWKESIGIHHLPIFVSQSMFQHASASPERWRESSSAVPFAPSIGWRSAAWCPGFATPMSSSPGTRREMRQALQLFGWSHPWSYCLISFGVYIYIYINNNNSRGNNC